jgi:hypothetical protein
MVTPECILLLRSLRYPPYANIQGKTMKNLLVAAAVYCVAGAQAFAQAPGTADGQWHYLGGDSAHTRYSPADQIDADNFEDLEEAWVWDGASFNAASGRSTPSYIDGILYTVAGPRRMLSRLIRQRARPSGHTASPTRPDTNTRCARITAKALPTPKLMVEASFISFLPRSS